MHFYIFIYSIHMYPTAWLPRIVHERKYGVILHLFMDSCKLKLTYDCFFWSAHFCKTVSISNTMKHQFFSLTWGITVTHFVLRSFRKWSILIWALLYYFKTWFCVFACIDLTKQKITLHVYYFTCHYIYIYTLYIYC